MRDYADTAGMARATAPRNAVEPIGPRMADGSFIWTQHDIREWEPDHNYCAICGVCWYCQKDHRGLR